MHVWAMIHGIYEVKLVCLSFREIFDRQTGRSFSGTASSSSIFSSEDSSIAFLTVSLILSVVDSIGSISSSDFDEVFDVTFDDTLDSARDTFTDDTVDDTCDTAIDEVFDDVFDALTAEFCDSSVGISDSIICDS